MEYNYWKVKTKDLPSKGLFYDEDFEIFVRPLSVLDVKYLHTINDYNCSDIVNEIIKRCTKFTNLDYQDLLLADREYISFWIRANSFKSSSGFKINIKECPVCHNPFEQQFELNNFDQKFIKAKVYDVYLPKSGITLPLKLPAVKDLKYLPEDAELNEYKKICIFIDSNNSFEEKYQFLQKMNVYDFAILKKYVKLLDCGMDKRVMTECPICHHSQYVEIALNPNQIFNRIKLSDVLNTISRIAKYSHIQITNDWLWMEVEFEQDEINKMIKEENEETQREINKAKAKTNSVHLPSQPSIPHMSTSNIHRY